MAKLGANQLSQVSIPEIRPVRWPTWKPISSSKKEPRSQLNCLVKLVALANKRKGRTMGSETSGSRLQLAWGTLSFAVCFAAWGLISAFAPRFRELFQLTATQTALLVAVPVVLGGLLRIVTGMLADRFGGRAVFAA